MSTVLKNRLVGTIILVAVAVIFLPDLLDGKKESRQNLFADLPARPEVKKVVAPENFDANAIKQAATRQVEVIDEQAVDRQRAEQPGRQTDKEQKISDTSQDLQNSALPDAVVKPTVGSLAEETIVEESQERLLASAGWVVQLGSFRHQKNVRELLDKLEKSGYRAFSRPVQTSSGLLTKVFVGPDLQKDKLEKALPHLKEITDLQGRVTPFTVQ